MLRDEDLAFARVAWQMDLLPLEDVLQAVSSHARNSAPKSLLRETLVRDGWLSEDEAVVVARAVLDRPRTEGMHGRRYEVKDIIGKGANGVVHAAEDTRLGRQVAVKLHSKGAELGDIELLRFAHEAQVTGQLPHPSIVPVHDLGFLPDGQPYYTMKQIEGETLKEVFDGIKHDRGNYVDTWTIPHLVARLLRVAEACAYAHDRGVVHRDIKPANIMVGDYGEVLLLDWGVARVLGTGQKGHVPVSTWRSEGDDDLTIVGTVAGTPAYMAPEQARGDIDAIGPAADVYSIGVVLWEFLTGTRPFRASNVRELLGKVANETIRPPSELRTRRRVPRDLEELCMKCVHKDPAKRYRNGRELAEALELFHEGALRQERAAKLVRRGNARATAYARAAEAASTMESDLRILAAGVAPWAPLEDREELIRARKEWSKLRSLRDGHRDEAISLFQAALQIIPSQRGASSGLADLYLRRMDEAAARGESKTAEFFRNQVLHYDNGALKRILEGPSTVSVDGLPSNAEVTLHRLEKTGAALEPTQSRPLGTGSIRDCQIDAGSWLVELDADGFEPAVLSLYLSQPGDLPIEVSLCPTGLLHDGFVHIPAGRFIEGGDPRSIDGSPRRVTELRDYAIAREPVTTAAYLEFLELGGGKAGFECWAGPAELNASEKNALPALAISRRGAEAYASWLSEREGKRFRLPTHSEWEKAARGADGRIYPWGDTWEPTHCNCPDAFRDQPRPEPSSAHPLDRSCFGVLALAGGVHEWVQGEVPHRADRGWLRGGSWNGHPQQARICSRLVRRLDDRGGTHGFRLVQELH